MKSKSYKRQRKRTDTIEPIIKRKRMTTSKLAMWFIFLNCTVVEVYSMAAMWHFGDLSPLYALLGAVVGQSLTYISYNNKACRENSRGGITYESAINGTYDQSSTVDNNSDVCG